MAGLFMLGLTLATLVDTLAVTPLGLGPSCCLIGRVLVMLIGFLTGWLSLLGPSFWVDLEEFGVAAPLVDLIT